LDTKYGKYKELKYFLTVCSLFIFTGDRLDHYTSHTLMNSNWHVEDGVRHVRLFSSSEKLTGMLMYGICLIS